MVEPLSSIEHQFCTCDVTIMHGCGIGSHMNSTAKLELLLKSRRAEKK